MADGFKIEGFDNFSEKRDLYLDIVFCLDLTIGNDKIIDMLKEFCSFIQNGMEEYCDGELTSLKKFRIKIISFGDSCANEKNDYLNSKFFEMPKDLKSLIHFFDKIESNLRWGDKRNGLEALATAMQSDWCVSKEKFDRVRHCVVILTDGKLYPEIDVSCCLKYGYSTNIPSSYNELLEWWDGKGSIMNPLTARLVLISPEESWRNLIEDFCSCDYAIANCDGHLDDWTFNEFLRFIRYPIIH